MGLKSQFCRWNSPPSQVAEPWAANINQPLLTRRPFANRSAFAGNCPERRQIDSLRWVGWQMLTDPKQFVGFQAQRGTRRAVFRTVL
jgi:hypothetical protein